MILAGQIRSSDRLEYLWGEAKMAVAIGAILVLTGFVRVIAFGYSMLEVIAIVVSLFAIVVSSIVIGAALPMLLYKAGFDPAHAGATIQVERLSGVRFQLPKELLEYFDLHQIRGTIPIAD